MFCLKKIILFLIFVIPALSFGAGEYHKIKPQSYSDQEIEWLVKNIYFESGNQSTAGRMAVLFVTLNRVQSKKFPNTIESVVTQGSGKKHKCQFSWYCDGKSDNIRDIKTHNDIQQLVKLILPFVSYTMDITDGALYYHATYVRPSWAKKMQKTVRIDDHIFYKEK